jgi:hypothetical protein
MAERKPVQRTMAYPGRNATNNGAAIARDDEARAKQPDIAPVRSTSYDELLWNRPRQTLSTPRPTRTFTFSFVSGTHRRCKRYELDHSLYGS